MTSGVVAQAAGLFAVTNFDDIVILSLFFAQAPGIAARQPRWWSASTSPSP